MPRLPASTKFPNLCFVDTLDNVGRHTQALGQTGLLFGSVSEENVERIRRQNLKKISVIIGNPPYNANQLNENDNNKNREYPSIDKRIKLTYIAESTAQKTKLYDMYARFFRWASDRLSENGVLALITNRSFIESRTFDGFRKVIVREFNDIYVVDLGGDVRANPKLSGTKHNVFGIQTGVAISFMVKRSAKRSVPPPNLPPLGGGTDSLPQRRRVGEGAARVYYFRRPEMETAEEKLSFLANNAAQTLRFDEVQPDRANNWVNLTNNDFESLIPLANKETKAAKTEGKERAIFKLFSLGASTNRDDWVYDFGKKFLSSRMVFLIHRYEIERLSKKFSHQIKWSRNLKLRAEQERPEPFSIDKIRQSNYRPFVSATFYDSKLFIDERGSLDSIFPRSQMQCCFGTIGDATDKPFSILATEIATDLNFLSPAAAGTKLFPLYRYDESARRHDNVTDWGLNQFQAHYEQNPLPQRGRARVGEAANLSPTKLFQPPPLPTELREFVRNLRNNATDAERALWQIFRGKQLGVKFRRQHPVAGYVLDFYCVERKLAVELDGGQHNSAEGRAHDAKRSAVLMEQGIRVIRFWNDEVFNNLDGVWQRIAEALGALPPPRPSPAGGGSDGAAAAITKEAIFHYCYAVLHDPIYREKYALNLKREFPRIPLYADFWQWADWGAALMHFHIGYEQVAPFPLTRRDIPGEKARAAGLSPKALLRADTTAGSITLDSETTLRGIPPEAWTYKLGNRSALNWVLDQYKEKKPKDPTIREKFDTYRFADYKEKVIDLLMRVTTVNVETMTIVNAMREAKR